MTKSSKIRITRPKEVAYSVVPRTRKKKKKQKIKKKG